MNLNQTRVPDKQTIEERACNSQLDGDDSEFRSNFMQLKRKKIKNIFLTQHQLSLLCVLLLVVLVRTNWKVRKVKVMGKHKVLLFFTLSHLHIDFRINVCQICKCTFNHNCSGDQANLDSKSDTT